MPDASHALGLPYLQPSQAQKHVTVNEALARLDLLVQAAVTAIGTTTPPTLPGEGETHVLGSGASGAWAGRDGDIACWRDGAWVFVAPRPGWRVFDLSGAALRIWDGTAWVLPPVPLEDLEGIGIGTTSDATNRLAVAAHASLFTHAGADHRLTVNKAATGDTASLLYQSGWTGHAEIGLTGGTDLSFKVSPDGSAWTEALRFDAATGRMTGAAMQQSVADTGAGRAMVVGAFGLGASMIDLGAGDNLDDITHSGFFYNGTGGNTPGNNYPVSSAGCLEVHYENSGRIWQEYTVYADGSGGPASKFRRSRGASGWTPWTMEFDRYSILGTVSQSGGVPTGAVIERGSNANGQYVRFADGTQICWHTVSFTDIATAAGAIYSSASDTNWTFPAVFSAVPDVKANSKTSSVEWAGVFCGTTTVAAIRGFRATSTSGSKSFGVFAIGRWF